MTTHIRVIFPSSKVDFHTPEDLNKINLSDCNIGIVSAKAGPEIISSRYEEVLAIPGTLERIVEADVEADNEGVHAVVIDCMGDPGVEQGRELVKIRQQAKLDDLESRLAVVSSIEIPPALLQSNVSQTTDEICQKALESIEIHGADTIIFGWQNLIRSATNVFDYILNKKSSNKNQCLNFGGND